MMNIWMAVSMDQYELPYAVANSAKDLAAICGVTENAIYAAVSNTRAGRVGRSRFVKVEVNMIEIKTRYTDWHEVDRATALRYAATLYGGMLCRGKISKVHSYIRGVRFTEKEIKDEIDRIANSRMR